MESREATKTRPKPRLGDARDYEEIMTRQEIPLINFCVM